MVRSPSGRLHVRTQSEFNRELDRVEFEVTAQQAGSGRLNLDVVFAGCGYYIDGAGRFVDVVSGASAPMTGLGISPRLPS